MYGFQDIDKFCKDWWRAARKYPFKAILYLVLAIFAMFFIIFFGEKVRQFAASDKRADSQARRPNFTISDPGFKPSPESSTYRIQIIFENTGLNPATRFEGEILLVDESFKEKPKVYEPISIANDIPRNCPMTWHSNSGPLGTNMSKKYIILRITYFDPVLKEEFQQSFFMKWAGVKNGNVDSIFTSVTKSERTQIEECLKTWNLL